MRLLGPVGEDLAEWPLAQGRVFPTAPIFPRADGRFWTLTDYQNWRRRIYRPVTEALGLPPQSYALRHRFVTLLIQEGRDFREVARLAGHGPEVCARTSAHLFDEWDGAERVVAEEAIRRAPEPPAPRELTRCAAVCSRIVPAEGSSTPCERCRQRR